MAGGSNLARTELRAKLYDANIVPLTSPLVRGNGLAYLNLGNIGSVGLHHAGLNPAANLGK